MVFLKTLAVITLLIGWAEIVQAQAALPQNNNKNNDGVSGLIVNMTTSTDGINFFGNFLEFWREKPNNEIYSLEIGERSSKRFGNQVWIMYGQKRIFLANLPYKLDKIKAVGEQAADAAYEALLGLALQLNDKDPDIAADEL